VPKSAKILITAAMPLLLIIGHLRSFAYYRSLAAIAATACFDGSNLRIIVGESLSRAGISRQFGVEILHCNFVFTQDVENDRQRSVGDAKFRTELVIPVDELRWDRASE
jgi:hypothetical protein